MLLIFKYAWIALLALGVATGIVITGDLNHQAQAKEGEPAVSAAGAQANVPQGRKPVAIVDGFRIPSCLVPMK